MGSDGTPGQLVFAEIYGFTCRSGAVNIFLNEINIVTIQA
jgi:hypothetical protein